MKLQKAIAECCERVLARGDEFDADDVLERLYADYTDEIAEYSAR
jgi:hypothetical protein